MRIIKRTPENVRLAIELDRGGLSRREIGERFGVGESTVRQWVDAEYYEGRKRYMAEYQRERPLVAKRNNRRRRERMTQEDRDREASAQRLRYALDPRVKERLKGLAEKYRRTGQGRLSQKVRIMVLAYAGRFPNCFESLMRAITGMSRLEFTKRFGGGGDFDHVVPLCAFDLTNPEHLVRCNHPSNLRVVPRRENQLKGKRVPKGLDILALPWIGTQDALVQAQSFISRQLSRLEQINGSKMTKECAA